MRTTPALIAALGMAVLAAAPPAEAKGCLKGAVVGGLAGHAVHHGVLGALGGCAVGHHYASKKAKQAHHHTAPPPPNG